MAKNYDKEFKVYAVKQILDEGKKAAEVCRDLDIAQQTLSRWVKQYQEDKDQSFVGSGNLKSEDKRIKELEKRLRDLEEENAILKKATAIFAKSQK